MQAIFAPGLQTILIFLSLSFCVTFLSRESPINSDLVGSDLTASE